MSRSNQKQSLYRLSLLRLGLLLVLLLVAGHLSFDTLSPAVAAPARQVPIFTPTPGPDGRIIYIVKKGDTLLSISLLTGVSQERLRELNKLNGDIIIEGQPLLLGLAGPPLATSIPGQIPTATPLLPTPSPKPGTGNLCVLLFNDLNGDSIRQENEPAISDGEISVSDRVGSVSLTAHTQSGGDPQCFDKVPEGDYNISVGVPGGFNPTTVTNYALSLKAGDETYLDFGAQVNSENQADTPIPTSGGKNPLLGIVGGLLLVAGAGLAVFAGRLLKGEG